MGSDNTMNSKIPIWSFGRGVMTSSDPSWVITMGSAAEKSKGVSSSVLESAMVLR